MKERRYSSRIFVLVSICTLALGLVAIFVYCLSGSSALAAHSDRDTTFASKVNRSIPADGHLQTADVSVSGGLPSGWEIECVDCSREFRNMTDRSLVLDANGHPHIAYGDRYLFHAWHDGEQWHTEIVDNEEWSGRFTSITMDSDGYPHISYYNYTNDQLKYAFQDGTGWQIQIVTVSDRLGKTSLVLDSNDNPHISYHDGIPSKLNYAHLDNSSWYTHTIDSNGRGGSMAIDQDGDLHIGYYDSTSDNYVVKYAHQDNSGWQIEEIDPHLLAKSVISSSPKVSLALNNDGNPHITCYSVYEGSPADLMHIYRDASEWYIEVGIEEDDVTFNNSLAIDDNGYAHVSYQGGESDGLVYAYQTSTGWYSETVDYAGGGEGSEFTSLALDGDGYPHIAYQIETSRDLLYAYQDGSGWHLQQVDRYGILLGDISMALDSDDRPHISYNELNIGELRYAHLNSAGWYLNTLERGYEAGFFNQIALIDDSPGIAFFMDHMLNYYHLGSVHIVDDGGDDVGRSLDLALDKDGTPHISYCGDYELDYGPCQELRYAYLAGPFDWQVESVDTGGNIGSATSIAMDENDYPHISYNDGSNDSVKYAYKDNSGWHREMVDYGEGSSLALDDQGYIHMSYFDDDNDDLKYAYQDSSGWNKETVESDGNVGSESSLVLDDQGYPHISYSDYTKSLLKYAYMDEEGWHIRSVGVDGRSSSLDLDSEGHAHIGFRLDLGVWYAYDTGVTYTYLFIPMVVSK